MHSYVYGTMNTIHLILKEHRWFVDRLYWNEGAVLLCYVCFTC